MFRGSVPIIVQKNFLLTNLSFLAVSPRLVLNTYWCSFQQGTNRGKLKLTAHLHLLPSQRMRGGTTVLHTNQLRYLLYRSTETI